MCGNYLLRIILTINTHNHKYIIGLLIYCITVIKIEFK